MVLPITTTLQLSDELLTRHTLGYLQKISVSKLYTQYMKAQIEAKLLADIELNSVKHLGFVTPFFKATNSRWVDITDDETIHLKVDHADFWTYVTTNSMDTPIDTINVTSYVPRNYQFYVNDGGLDFNFIGMNLDVPFYFMPTNSDFYTGIDLDGDVNNVTYNSPNGENFRRLREGYLPIMIQHGHPYTHQHTEKQSYNDVTFDSHFHTYLYERYLDSDYAVATTPTKYPTGHIDEDRSTSYSEVILLSMDWNQESDSSLITVGSGSTPHEIDTNPLPQYSDILWDTDIQSANKTTAITNVQIGIGFVWYINIG